MSSLALLGRLGALALAAGVAAAQPAALRFEVPAPGTLSDRPMSFNGLVQDRAGFLWLATDEGLYRYDGVGFTRFRTDPDDPAALPGDRILVLAEAPDGRLWAVVDRYGLVRFDPQRPRFERFPFPAGVEPGALAAVDAAGAPWLFDGARRDLLRLDPAARRFRRIGLPAGVSAAASTLTRDGAGRIWMFNPAGLYRFEGTRAVRVGESRQAMLSPRDARGAVWFIRAPAGGAGPYRLYRLEPGRPGPVHVGDLSAAALGGQPDAILTVDRRNVAWLRVDVEAGWRLVALDLTSGRAVAYAPRSDDPGGLPDARLQHMLEDREGVLWLATMRGLRKVVPRWTAFRAVPLPPTAMGYGLAPGAAGTVYAGTLDGPLFRFVPGPDTLAPLALPAGRPARYAHVFPARGGGLWLAGWDVDASGGLYRLFPSGRAARYRHDPADPTSITSNALRVVLEDAAGRTWVGTEGGLDRLDPATGRFTHVRLGAAATAGANPIWALAEAGGGRLWVGTYGGGLLLHDPATGRTRAFRRDPDDPTTISGDVVSVLHRSRAEPGVWWVGTFDGGLNRFEPRTGRFVRFTRRDGMPGLSVKSILEDRRGVLWVGTEAGLVRLDPRKPPPGEAAALRVFTEADGLPGADFGLYDAAALPDGRLAFIVGGEVVAFDPLRLEGGRFAAPVALRSLRVLGRPHPAPAPGAPLRLGPGEEVFSVEAVALSFTAPERLLYAYRLDPVDAAWVPMGTERTASFAHLPAGRYTLRVRAGTASGAWSPHELRLPVVVVPPWWATGWFRALAALAVLAGVAAGVRTAVRRRYRRRIGRMEAEREAERRLQAERERISRDLHDHVGAQVASLLSGIELARLARRAADGPPTPPAGDGAAEDPLDTVEADARATLTRLRETIWALHHEAVTLGAFRDRLEAHLRERLRGRAAPSATVVLDGDDAQALSPMQALNLYRIAQEAATNALKHAGATRLTVTLRADDAGVTLEVADDGAFRPPRNVGSGGDGSDGGGDGLSGYGLDSMRRRAEALGGRFALDTAAGTRVRVSVPREAPAPLPGPAHIPGAGD